ncbi:MAG: hypothetical protein IT437_12060 [Phycisphaerales bacterium]|nr:hypothetical protein [Phycisphaerales bacterium]
MTRRIVPALFLLAGVSLGAGCNYWGYRPGGQEASNDLYTYPSTPEIPQTVVLRDWTTKEVIWSIDIPQGQQLVMQFHKDRNKKNDPNRPDTLRWRLMPLGQERGNLANEMTVPDENHRFVAIYRTGDQAIPPVTTGP